MGLRERRSNHRFEWEKRYDGHEEGGGGAWSLVVGGCSQGARSWDRSKSWSPPSFAHCSTNRGLLNTLKFMGLFWSGSWPLLFVFLFFLVIRYSSGHPGGDLPQPSSSSSGLRLPISVPPVERSGRQRVFVEGAMPTGGVPSARHLQNTLRLETVLLLVQEEKKSDQESKRG